MGNRRQIVLTPKKIEVDLQYLPVLFVISKLGPSQEENSWGAIKCPRLDCWACSSVK